MTVLSTEERINQLTNDINNVIAYNGYYVYDIHAACRELYRLQMQLNEEQGVSNADLWRTEDLD